MRTRTFIVCTREAAVVLCVLFATLFLRSLLHPAFTDIAITPQGGERTEATLPIDIEHADFQSMGVDFTAHLSGVHPAFFEFSPDDCIDAIVINGKQLHDERLPYCDSGSPLMLPLGAHLGPGPNTFTLVVRNLGWRFGFDVRAAFFDPVMLLPWMAPLLLLVRYAWILKRPGSRRTLASFVRGHGRLLANMTIVAALVVMLYAIHDFTLRIWYELQAPFTADTPIYWAVGRGIYNGLVPYRDLFETKPPGIFLLSALSIAFTGGQYLLHVLQALTLACIPATLLLFFSSMRNLKGRMSMIVFFETVAACFFALMLGSYVADRAGEVQVESFGALFGMLALFGMIIRPDAFSRSRTAAIALCIFLAVGLKEPFVLSIAAGAMILARSKRSFMRGCAWPTMYAGIAGLSALAALGYLKPYVTIYLDEMLGNHISSAGPFWLRGFDVAVLWHDLRAFSPWFAWSFVFLCGLFVAMPTRSKNMAYAVACRAGVLMLAAYLTALAVGAGGAYWNHHFVFAVPLYAAVFIAVFRDTGKRPFVVRSISTLCLVVMLAAGIVQRPHIDYQGALDASAAWSRDGKHMAAIADRLMDACGVERYLFLGGNGPHPYGYTEHSPLGPLFFQYPYFFEGTRDFFREGFTASLQEARVIIRHVPEIGVLEPSYNDYIDAAFTPNPWECATESLAEGIPAPYRLLYRRGP